MAKKELIDIIKELRKKGFGDGDIRKSLLNQGSPLIEIESAFNYLVPKYVNKNQVTLFLSDELISVLDKRAKKNMFTLNEQIEDILRRSTINQMGKKSIYDGKLDDALVGLFSRKNTGPKKK